MSSPSLDILIVEDSRLQAKVLRDLLLAQGYNARIAYDGQQGLQMARELKPALVLCDIVMPLMDGYDMCANFKADARLHDVPIIMLTSLSDIEDVVLGLQSRADFYLTKPYSNDYLFSTMRHVLEEANRPMTEHSNIEYSIEAASPFPITVGGKTRFIDVNRRQIVNLLLSTYGNAVEQNRTLQHTQNELQSLNDQLRMQARHIEEQQKKLEDANAQLFALATHDGLTGLKNQTAFKERLHEEVARTVRTGESLSLLLVDVDFFKQFNDTYGHPAGDEVLRTVAQILRDECRTADFVARYGGEEFAVLLPNTNRELSLYLAERLRDAIQSYVWPLRPITISGGATTFDRTTPLVEAEFALLETADQALYHSKRTGRNRITHSAELVEIASQ